MEEACSLRLKWDEFEKNIIKVCRENRGCELFTDVTFIAENRKLAAHRIVLCASSEFFKMILSDVPPCTNPTITLGNIAYEDLEAVMEYIYTGQLPFCPEKLESVLETAACFQIESLIKVRAAVNGDDKMSDPGNISLDESISLSEISWNIINEEEKNFDNYEYNIEENSLQETMDSLYDSDIKEGQSMFVSDFNGINIYSDIPDSISRDGNSRENDRKMEVVQKSRRKKRKKGLRAKWFDIALEAVLNGVPISEAAWKYNVSKVGITNLLKEKIVLGDVPLKYVDSIKCKDSMKKEFIKNALLNGDTLEKIASDLNLSRSAIYYHRKRLIEEGRLKSESIKNDLQGTETYADI